MEPLKMFESHYRAADALLTVYRLFQSESGATTQHQFLPKLREMVQGEASEHVMLLFNDIFLGLVREQADIPAHFFGPATLSLLLRQSVVSACTALDVFVPALLNTHLETVIKIRGRNFLPTDGTVKTLMRDFRLSLEELPALLDEEDAERRWNLLTQHILQHLRKSTLSNVDSIGAVMLMLGVPEPWKRVAQRASLTEGALREQVKTLVTRRNGIVHRGDRPNGQPDAPPQPIEFDWTSIHVTAARTVALACNALVTEEVRRLKTDAGMV